MTDPGSITCLIGGLKGGEDEEIQRLWDRYFTRLARLAASKLPAERRRAVDEEDIALSAFHSFCARAARGQFDHLEDRDDLWKLLATITTRKLFNTLRLQSRKKRGGGRVFGESGIEMGDGDLNGLAQVLGREPTPEAAAALAEDCERLFDKLDDPILKTIAQRKLDGFSTAEIATELKVTVRTVDRKLGVIRAIWEDEAR